MLSLTSPEVADTLDFVTCFMWPRAPMAFEAQSGQSMPSNGQLTAKDPLASSTKVASTISGSNTSVGSVSTSLASTRFSCGGSGAATGSSSSNERKTSASSSPPMLLPSVLPSSNLSCAWLLACGKGNVHDFHSAGPSHAMVARRLVPQCGGHRY